VRRSCLLLLGSVVAAAVVVTGCARTPGGDGLAGRLVGIDDTGRGDYELGGGWIAAVPADRASELWDSGGLSEQPAELTHAQIEIDEADLVDLDGVLAEVTDAGRFRLDVPPGPAIICWLEPAEAAGIMFSWGCSEVDVPSDGKLEASWGEGGFFVAVG
jgi:hypothetical protein